MKGIVFPIRFFQDKRKYWAGFLYNKNKLYALILPLLKKQNVLKRLRKLTGNEIIFKENKKQIKKIQDYFIGKRQVWQEQIDLSGYSIFAQRVLKQVKNIPYGQIRTYSWVAKKVHSPRAMRAVGSVLAKNRIPLIIPCHRVIKKNGQLGRFSAGFGQGLKKIMLSIESK